MWCGLPSSRTSTQLSQETHWKIMDWAMLEVSGGAVVSGTRKENGCRSRGHPGRMKFTRSGFDVPKGGAAAVSRRLGDIGPLANRLGRRSGPHRRSDLKFLHQRLDRICRTKDHQRASAESCDRVGDEFVMRGSRPHRVAAHHHFRHGHEILEPWHPTPATRFRS